jgi:uracil phosphoribosyltransferase
VPTPAPPLAAWKKTCVMSGRLGTLVVSVATPCGAFEGLQVPSGGELAVVSIVRAGDALQEAVRQIAPSAALGKILIQRDEETALPTLMYSKLPPDVAMRQVLLLDPMLATGGSAVKAIECLVEKGVRPENIIFVNIVCVREGIAAIHNKYPQVKIVTGAIDPILNSKSYIVPGLGDFGDRYFGTDGRD